MQLIKYEVFQQRKQFNPLILFKRNPNLTYTDFKEFLNSRLVEEPDVSYFNRVKKVFDEEQQTSKIEPIKDITEIISTQENNSLLSAEANLTETNSEELSSTENKSKRRRKKKQDDEN